MFTACFCGPSTAKNELLQIKEHASNLKLQFMQYLRPLKDFLFWQSPQKLHSPLWWSGTKAASSLCTWLWLDWGRIGTRWPGWSCPCGCKQRTPVRDGQRERVSDFYGSPISDWRETSTSSTLMQQIPPCLEINLVCDFSLICSGGSSVYESWQNWFGIKSLKSHTWFIKNESRLNKTVDVRGRRLQCVVSYR